MHGGFVPEGVGSMPGVEAMAAAALLFWAPVARELFWWGGFSTFQAGRVLIRVGWGVCSFSRPCGASPGRVFLELKCVVCGMCLRTTPLRNSNFYLLPLPRG